MFIILYYIIFITVVVNILGKALDTELDRMAPRKTFFDNLNWPFVWNNLTERDYITGYAEDTWYSTFKYLKKGFKEQVM